MMMVVHRSAASIILCASLLHLFSLTKFKEHKGPAVAFAFSTGPPTSKDLTSVSSTSSLEKSHLLLSFLPKLGADQKSSLLPVALCATLLVSMFSFPEMSSAVLGSGGCASGVGDACSELAGDNVFIQELQARSAKNRDVYARQNLEAYYMKNYPDFFASIGKTLIKKQDGTFMTVDDKELESLKKSNRLSYVMPKAMGGAVTDVTQKPIPILRE
jgi:hypothetical protein